MERIGNSRGVGGSKTQEIPEVRVVGWGVNKGGNWYHLSQLSMFDWPLMLWVNLLVADTIHPESDKFATGVKIKATG